MILKILLFATCGILSVLAVGGKTGAKEGYKVSPSGLDALRRVRSTLVPSDDTLRRAMFERFWKVERFYRSQMAILPACRLSADHTFKVVVNVGYWERVRTGPHGPQPTFTASPASARPPPMAPHVAPSLSGFSSFGQVPPMLNVNDMVAQHLRYELQQVNADIQQYTQHATFAVLSPQQLQHWNGLVERSVLLHAQLQNMGSG